MTDKYKNFKELEKENECSKDYFIEYKENSDILIMAIHGGYIELGTSEIAKYISNLGNFSFYCFYGNKKENNFNLHITSVNFDEPIGLKLALKHKIIITIHGCKGNNEIFVGGGNTVLRNKLIKNFQQSGFNAPDFSDDFKFKGLQKENICNRGKLQGIQIEIGRVLRDNLISDKNLLNKFALIILNIHRFS
ncbi:MAG: poly-gamma-glutamate hydrolase family protein [Candidatus Gracilibacteria bacterium]|nr:poly-gamma-glutamate hydrolase family protein [Candidatus Gracilibacteria bacterium]